MEVKILKQSPEGIIVENVVTGKEIKYSRQFFKKRLDIGYFKIKNDDKLKFPIL